MSFKEQIETMSLDFDKNQVLVSLKEAPAVTIAYEFVKKSKNMIAYKTDIVADSVTEADSKTVANFLDGEAGDDFSSYIMDVGRLSFVNFG